jgi:hypothetical protein
MHGGDARHATFWSEPEGKRPLGRIKHKQEGNTKKNLREIG